MNCLVTGGAGFIGSNLVDALLRAGHQVMVYDNFSTGQERTEPNLPFAVVRGEISNSQKLQSLMSEYHFDVVFHLAANADVRHGWELPYLDFFSNGLGTLSVLEAMRQTGTEHIVFTSTASVYGNVVRWPTPEDWSASATSLYAASKLTAEHYIEAYCSRGDMQAHVFRLVGVLGERYSHGHVIDFYRALREHHQYLDVLGNGRQRKSYVYIQDVVSALLMSLSTLPTGTFNVGTDEFCTVDESVGWICEYMKASPEVIHHGPSVDGWIGDLAIYLDCSLLREKGWKPMLNIKESVVRTLDYLMEQPHEVAR